MTLKAGIRQLFFILYNSMAAPNLYDSDKPIERSCIVCNQGVPSEKNIGRDQFGREIVWYTPASRYWSDAGVFCSADHSLEHSLKGKS